MKQLIETMISDYLNESHEDDLVESIFEEVSEETWEAIEEAILHELSPELLARYKKKANKQVDRAYDSAHFAKSDKVRQKNKDRIRKRESGLSMSNAKEKSDLKNLSSDDFQKKYRMSKSEWQRKNKKSY